MTSAIRADARFLRLKSIRLGVGVACVALSSLGFESRALASPRDEADLAAPHRKAVCGGTVRVEAGDSFAEISLRCYGSRVYSSWIIEHNHHGKKSLRANETLEIPSFETLVHEQLAAKWQSQRQTIAEAYDHFRAAEEEIDTQLRAAKPGAGSYRPSRAAKANLEKAANALHRVAKHLKKAGAKTKKFAQAEVMVTAFAHGGEFSTDYAVEEIHQCFSYGVDALD